MYLSVCVYHIKAGMSSGGLTVEHQELMRYMRHVLAMGGVCAGAIGGIKFMRVWVACIIHAAQGQLLYFK